MTVRARLDLWGYPDIEGGGAYSWHFDVDG